MDVDLNLRQSSQILEESNESETIESVRVCRKLPSALLSEVWNLYFNCDFDKLGKLLRVNIK
jgi:hypothetical protein